MKIAFLISVVVGALACLQISVLAQDAAPRAIAVTEPASAYAAPEPATAEPLAATAGTTVQSGQSHGGVALRVGDPVEIHIANVPSDDIQQFNGVYTLDEGGNLNLPYIGLLKASGMPPSQVQVLIQNKLISAGIYTNPTISVNPPTASRFISVSGQVRAPGRIPYSSDLTLMTAIGAAGGPSDFAGDKIRLVRGGKVQFFKRKLLEKDPSKDPAISPGDQIEIMQSWF